MAKGINSLITETIAKVEVDLYSAHLPISVVTMMLENLLNKLKVQEQYALEQEVKQEEVENQKPKQEVVPNDFKDEVR